MSRERLPISPESSVREWFELTTELGLSHAEACRRMGLPESTMDARLRRARDRGDI